MAIITISRQFGSGGIDLGHRLANRLKYRYVDKEIIDEVAQRIGVSQEGVIGFEKSGSTKMIDFIEKFIDKDFIRRRIAGPHGYLDEKAYVAVVKDIIEGFYRMDNTILMGRGGQYILKKRENTWHILIVGDKESRVRNIMKRFRITKEEALREITQADKNRLRFLNSLSDEKSHEDPSSYDMILNMNRISIKKTEDIIIALVSG